MNIQTFCIMFFLALSAGVSAQTINFREIKKNDSLAVNNVQEILWNAKENYQERTFVNPAPSEIRINASMLNRNNRSFNPLEPRNFEINNDIHYLPPNINLPPVGLQKLTEIRIYQSK